MQIGIRFMLGLAENICQIAGRNVNDMIVKVQWTWDAGDDVWPHPTYHRHYKSAENAFECANLLLKDETGRTSVSLFINGTYYKYLSWALECMNKHPETFKSIVENLHKSKTPSGN